MQRQNIASGTPWKEIVGYSRAVRTGPFIHVTGTLAADEHGRMIGIGDAYAQTVAAIGKIEQALKEAGDARGRRPHPNLRHRHRPLERDRPCTSGTLRQDQARDDDGGGVEAVHIRSARRDRGRRRHRRRAAGSAVMSDK